MNIKSKIQTNSAYILIIILVEFVVLNLLIFNPETIINILDYLGLFMNPTASSTIEDIQKIYSNNLMVAKIGWILVRVCELIILILFSLTGYLCNRLLPLPAKIKFRYLPLFIPFLYLFLYRIAFSVVDDTKYIYLQSTNTYLNLQLIINTILIITIGYLLAKSIFLKNNLYKIVFPFIFPISLTLIYFICIYYIILENSEYIQILPIFYGLTYGSNPQDNIGPIVYPIILYAAFAISFIVFDRFRIKREKNKHQLI